MTHVAPALPHPSDILSWSWRSSPQKKPFMSSPVYHQQHPVVLPPIKHLEFEPLSPSLPQYELEPAPSPPPEHSPPSCSASTQWYGPRTSASTVSEKTAEMISYLWFSSKRDPTHRTRRMKTSPTFTSKIDPATAAMQFSPSTKFIQYVRKLLETTQISQSVIVLSLHYVYRLRQQNSTTPAQSGSEFRVAVVALMLANKFLDDNTYTNKTWSEVAGINLEELNRMEREFLLGIDSRLYVDKGTYESWLQLLKGLVLAKEREHQLWQYLCRKTGGAVNAVRRHLPQTLSTDLQGSRTTCRPRSTSPRNSVASTRTAAAFTFSMPLRMMSHTYTQTSPCTMDAEDDPMRSGIKRSAPSTLDNYGTPSRPAKRVAALQMDRLSVTQGPRSAAPAFASSGFTPTNAFSTLSIANSDTSSVHPRPSPRLNDVHPPAAQSLVQPYTLNQLPLNSQPQHLYFYTLAGSPLDAASRPQADRKAQLRYATTESASGFYAPQPMRLRPLLVHSANVSPRDVALHAGSRAPWNDGLEQRQLPIPSFTPKQPLPPHHHSTIPVAHFANAGPPGVQWSVSTPGSMGWTR